jgi:oxazoline/thiazoline dehydrogenase
MEMAFYPYPGDGARSELGVYLVVAEGQGLTAGLYRYEAGPHALTPMSSLTPEVIALQHDARAALAAPVPPPLLLIFSARFRRVSWKYRAWLMR